MILAIVKDEYIDKVKEKLDKPVFANPLYLSNTDFADVESVYFDNSTKKYVEKFSDIEELKGVKIINIDDKPKENTKTKEK